jgi:hypothetical protein
MLAIKMLLLELERTGGSSEDTLLGSGAEGPGK